MDRSTEIELEAAAFRRLLAHLDAHKELQNIDLMNLAGFCRQLPRQVVRGAGAGARAGGRLRTGRERVYGMPYAEWKARYQTEATPEQLQKFPAAKPG